MKILGRRKRIEIIYRLTVTLSFCSTFVSSEGQRRCVCPFVFCALLSSPFHLVAQPTRYAAHVGLVLAAAVPLGYFLIKG
ncbi:hypothetical protein BKA57DRAFT_256101 [Linnemannia elongata]|nr:hypothetical protein BKA57DRAFT_256101 [Linnemannia elongata]